VKISSLLAALDALLPCACAGCGTGVPSESVLCARCELSVHAIAADACPRCQLHRTGSGICPDTGPLEAAVAAVWLEPPVSDWIHAFKYPPRGLRSLAPGPIAAIAELAARAARRAPGPAPDLVVPIPLHPRRLRARGFNPALTAARAAARVAGAAVSPTALERLRDTPSQTGFDAAARRRNVRGAMRARPPGPGPRVGRRRRRHDRRDAARRGTRAARGRRGVGDRGLRGAHAVAERVTYFLPTVSRITSISRFGSTGFLKITPSSPSMRLRLITCSRS
jgi:predicted amidophosphoribosyltransferase